MESKRLFDIMFLLLGLAIISEGHPVDKNCPYHNCVVSPCLLARCTAPGAVCVDDICGGCHKRWFLDDKEVTHLCANKTRLPDVNNCTYPFNCFIAPCLLPRCSVPNAVCLDEHCGGCRARWFVDDLEVTDLCSEKPKP